MATPHRIYVPKIRPGQSVIKSGRDVFAWGGIPSGVTYNNCDDATKMEILNSIDVYDHFTNKWRNLPTQGQPPLGIHKYACSSLNDNKIYYFGGHCGHDQCYHNSLYELNISDFDNITWTEILPTEENGPIKRKIECGLFCFTANHNDYALIVGGKVNDEGTPLSSFETRNPRKKGTVFTRECHIVDLATGDIVLTQEGPLSADFQFVGMTTSMDDHTPRAIAYGGDYSDGLHKDIHIAEIEANIDNKLQLKWTTVYARRHSINVWPRRRHHYAVCALGAWQSLILISGCDKKDGKCLRECWIFNYKSRQWSNVGFPDQLIERMGHSIVAWAVTPNCMRVAVIGGTTSTGEMVHQQFASFEIYLVNKDKREVSDVINLNTANEYLLHLSGVEHLKGLIKEIQTNWEKRQIELDFERECLEKDREEIECEKEELKRSKQKFAEEREKLDNEEKEFDDERQKFEQERDEIEKEIHKIQNKEEDFDEMLAELQNEKEQLENQNNEVKRKEEEVELEKEELELEKKKIEKQKSNLRHEKEDIEHEREELEHEKEDFDKEKYEFEHKEEDLQNEIEELEYKKAQLEKEKETIEHKAELLEHKKYELDHVKEEIEEERHKLEDEEKELKHQREDLQHEKEDLEKEKHKIEEDLQHKSEELQHKSEELQHKSEELQHKSEELQHKTEELQHKTEELQYREEDIEHKRQELEHKEANLEHKAQDLKSEKSLELNQNMTMSQEESFTANIEREEEELTEVTEEDFDDSDTLYEFEIDSNISNWNVQQESITIPAEQTGEVKEIAVDVSEKEVDKEIKKEKDENEEIKEEKKIDSNNSWNTSLPTEQNNEIKQQTKVPKETLNEKEEERDLKNHSKLEFGEDEEKKRQEYIKALEIKIKELAEHKNQAEEALVLQQNTLKKERQKIVQNNENTNELISLLKDKLQQKSEEIETLKGTFLQNNKVLRDMLQKFHIVTPDDV